MERDEDGVVLGSTRLPGSQRLHRKGDATREAGCLVGPMTAADSPSAISVFRLSLETGMERDEDGVVLGSTSLSGSQRLHRKGDATREAGCLVGPMTAADSPSAISVFRLRQKQRRRRRHPRNERKNRQTTPRRLLPKNGRRKPHRRHPRRHRNPRQTQSLKSGKLPHYPSLNPPHI
jgi:hypothetical protein